MEEALFSKISAMLQRRRKLKIRNDWLRSCVDWIHQESQGTSLSVEEIYNQVYDQWLITNLYDLQTPCLPDSVDQKLYTLDGCFNLQVNNVIDISQPCFQQLVKKKGRENENVHIEASNQPTQEVKSSRMLMLELTDGCNIVKGLEYKPIPSLNTDIRPGLKVVIKGPVECRRRILLLKRENLEILGGCVEELFEENGQEKILSSIIGTDLNDCINCWTSTNISSARNLDAQRDSFNGANNRRSNNNSVVNRGGNTSAVSNGGSEQARLDSFLSTRSKVPSNDHDIIELGSDDDLEEMARAMDEDF